MRAKVWHTPATRLRILVDVIIVVGAVLNEAMITWRI